ncbi:MAG: AraC family transcriptional regulator [Chloroflexota bacterium]
MQLKQAVIVRGRGHHECELKAGVLSIKCMFNGSVLYETPDGRYLVDDSHYLILNDGQAYRMQKLSDVLSVCVFFPLDWASDILRASVTPDDALLDNPLQKQPVHFFETLQRHGDVASRYMQMIKHLPKTSTHIVDKMLHEEFLRDLLHAMLQSQRNIVRDATKLPDARPSTRIELLRRLRIARDYLHASYADALTIDQLASVAGLSPYHFIRKFKALFGQTPHQYLRQVRLEHARTLLLQTNQSITDICFAVGFQSLGSFSTIFHKQNGLSPRQYRLAHATSQF